jgi:hypothetical protein
MQYITEPENLEVFNIYMFMKSVNAIQKPGGLLQRHERSQQAVRSNGGDAGTERLIAFADRQKRVAPGATRYRRLTWTQASSAASKLFFHVLAYAVSAGRR